MKKALYIITTIVILALIAAGIYYWFFYSKVPPQNPDENIIDTGFKPIGNGNLSGGNGNQTGSEGNVDNTSNNQNSENSVYKLPKLRQISSAPVAGYVASTTASSSLVRFIDRGTGHIYEADNLSDKVVKISNTTLPKIYEAYSNKNGTNFILRYLKNDSDVVSNFYAELRKTGTSTTETPFEIKGKFISPDIKQIVISPAGDKVFTWNIENSSGVGYISAFDEKTKVKVSDFPFTQVNIDWPENNTLIVSTKPSAFSSSYIYSIDAKNGSYKSISSGVKGLSGRVSRDGLNMLSSFKNNDSFITSVLNIKNGSSQELIFKTLSDKCIWSNIKKDELFCAVPTEIPDAIYPDDWYKGKISFIDQIWHVNTTTGEVRLLANLTQLSNKGIDAMNLTLDQKENTLYFINKEDLNLWALDLNQ
jgi:hypothetical protein